MLVVVIVEGSVSVTVLVDGVGVAKPKHLHALVIPSVSFVLTYLRKQRGV